VLESPALALRVLLTNRVARLRLVVPDRQARALLGGQPWMTRLLGAAYELREAGREGAAVVVEAVTRGDDCVDPAGRLARDLVRHPAGAAGNVLREALVRVAGTPLTRNQARALVERHVDLTGHEASRAADLPLHTLRALTDALPDLAAAIAGP
jgi:hypothetical protein